MCAARLQSNRKPLAKFEAMQSEHFESLVKHSVQDPKQLAEALTLSKFTEHMILQEKTADDLDRLVS